MTKVQTFSRCARTFWLMAGLWILMVGAALAGAPEVARFVGTYTGTAVVETADGGSSQRDMSVEVAETKRGFVVEWTTTTYRQDGRTKEKAYKIEFVPSDRDGIFAAAMTKNVFGHAVQQDPMKGEPYVWARVVGDTLTVHSLFVNEDGGYEMQQFDRTLADGGMVLDFQTVRDGKPGRTINTFLTRQ